MNNRSSRGTTDPPEEYIYRYILSFLHTRYEMASYVSEKKVKKMKKDRPEVKKEDEPYYYEEVWVRMSDAPLLRFKTAISKEDKPSPWTKVIRKVADEKLESVIDVDGRAKQLSLTSPMSREGKKFHTEMVMLGRIFPHIIKEITEIMVSILFFDPFECQKSKTQQRYVLFEGRSQHKGEKCLGMDESQQARQLFEPRAEEGFFSHVSMVLHVILFCSLSLG